jgi:uncharacterized protein DUF4167
MVFSRTGALKSVRQGQQNRRGRGRNSNRKGGGHHGNPLSRSFESNGPDVKIRGTPAHIAEKYISLARDAQSTGDPVLAENYLQHAEHYSRIIMAYRDQFNQQGGDGPNGGGHRMRGPGDAGGEGFDEFGEDGDMGGEDGFQQPFVPQVPAPGHQPQPRSQGGEHHPRPERHQDQRQEHRQDQRPDRPFRRDQNRPRYGERGERGDRQGFIDRDRQPEAREPRGEARNEPQERAPDQVAESAPEPRRRERFQQVHEQPEFLRRPVRRTRSSENSESGTKSEPTNE